MEEQLSKVRSRSQPGIQELTLTQTRGGRIPAGIGVAR
jgi:hypothetical protein